MTAANRRSNAVSGAKKSNSRLTVPRVASKKKPLPAGVMPPLERRPLKHAMPEGSPAIKVFSYVVYRVGEQDFRVGQVFDNADHKKIGLLTRQGEMVRVMVWDIVHVIPTGEGGRNKRLVRVTPPVWIEDSLVIQAMYDTQWLHRLLLGEIEGARALIVVADGTEASVLLWGATVFDDDQSKHEEEDYHPSYKWWKEDNFRTFPISMELARMWIGARGIRVDNNIVLDDRAAIRAGVLGQELTVIAYGGLKLFEEQSASVQDGLRRMIEDPELYLEYTGNGQWVFVHSLSKNPTESDDEEKKRYLTTPDVQNIVLASRGDLAPSYVQFKDRGPILTIVAHTASDVIENELEEIEEAPNLEYY